MIILDLLFHYKYSDNNFHIALHLLFSILFCSIFENKKLKLLNYNKI